MNKFILIPAVLALSMLSSCGDYGDDSPSVLYAYETVPSVTFMPATTAQTTVAPIKTSVVSTTTTEPVDIPEIKKISDMRNSELREIPSEYYIENVEVIYQEPELPAGCEITSLTMLLNYLGYDIDKVDLCDNYLKKNYDYTQNFYEAFIGNPKDGTGFGCYAPVIAEAAQEYLKDMKSDMDIYDLSGTEFRDLFSYIADDKPVVIWASMGLVDVRYYNVWTIEKTNEDVWWYENEHCMLLTGYDIDNETVTVCDPLRGEYTYDIYRFEEIYNELEKQAVTIF